MLRIKYTGNGPVEDAKISWGVDFTGFELDEVIEQLADNLALADIILADESHIKENLPELREIVNTLKLFAAARVMKTYDDRNNSRQGLLHHDEPGIKSLLKPTEIDEAKKIISVNSESKGKTM